MIITVFTPTFNRAALLPRVFAALLNQTVLDFEWIVIDDGSTDNTENVVLNFKESSPFEIVYRKQSNKGKVRSINEALKIARGHFFLVLDSDDWCEPHAFQRFVDVWQELGSEQSKYCSISSLKMLEDGSLVGEDFSRLGNNNKSYVDRFNLAIKGDKWECIVTSIHKKFLYELASNEKYMAPEYAWLKMGQFYKTIFLNEALGIIEYQHNGITKNNILHRASNPNSACYFYMLGEDCAVGISMKMRMSVNLARFSLHSRNFNRAKNYKLLGGVLGTFFYCWDLINLKYKAR